MDLPRSAARELPGRIGNGKNFITMPSPVQKRESGDAENPDILAPLCVSLEGALVRTNLASESLVRLLKDKPWILLFLPLWFLRGKAVLRQKLSAQCLIDARRLPYDDRVIRWLSAEKGRGRVILLTTSFDETLAREVAEHLGLFSGILTSDQIDPRSGFEYAGGAEEDFDAFLGCSGAILVNASAGFTRRVGNRTRIVTSFTKQDGGFRSYIRALRVHQWSKNILIFVPLVTSHQFLDRKLLLRGTITVVLLSLCSSAQYVLNDLIDIDSDRGHPIKKNRPFASGALPVGAGLLLSATLLATSLIIAWFTSHLLVGLLATYFVASLSYSLYLKRILLLDVFVLSGLYTFRIVSGQVVLGLQFSVWLVSFSLFLFLSLAFCKRMAELRVHERGGTEIAGRAYEPGDAWQVNIFGICSAFLAAVVFILYLQSDNVRELYQRPQILWLLAPVFLYWISRIWMVVHRGQLDVNDPVLFVLKDPVSYITAAVSGLVMLAAARNWFIPGW